MKTKVTLDDQPLAPVLSDFAEAEIREGGFGTASAYFSELLRQRRQAQIDADVKFLADAIQGAPPGPEPVKHIVAATKRIRRQMRQEQWHP